MKKHELWVLDFDRCLGDVDVLFEQFSAMLPEVGISAEAVARERKRVEDNGGSFDLLSYCQAALAPSTYEALKQRYLSVGHDTTYLEEGADALLDWLEASDRPHCILSYGSSEWQALKIRRAGLAAVRHCIVSTPKKSDVLRSWRQPDGRYRYPGEPEGERYDSVVLLDDKAVAFADMPENTRGYWYRHSVLLSSQAGEVDSDRVHTIASLHEIIEVEQGLD